MTKLYPFDIENRTLEQMAAAISEWFDAHPGCGKNPSDRINQMIEAVSKAVARGKVVSTGPEFKELLICLRELRELDFVIQVLGERLAMPPMIEKLRRAAMGAFRSDPASTHDEGRNYFFELFIAAFFARAGAAVDVSATATVDWVVEDNIRAWCVECKRLRSLQQLRKRVRKAAEQCSSEKKAGVIFLDLAPAFSPDNPENLLNRHISDEELHKAASERDLAFLKAHEGELVEVCRNSYVGAICIHDCLMVPPSPDGAWSQYSRWAWLHLRAEPEKQVFLHIESIFNAGQPQLGRDS